MAGVKRRCPKYFFSFLCFVFSLVWFFFSSDVMKKKKPLEFDCWRVSRAWKFYWEKKTRGENCYFSLILFFSPMTFCRLFPILSKMPWPLMFGIAESHFVVISLMWWWNYCNLWRNFGHFDLERSKFEPGELEFLEFRNFFCQNNLKAWRFLRPCYRGSVFCAGTVTYTSGAHRSCEQWEGEQTWAM